jgi:hypothetical protein
MFEKFNEQFNIYLKKYNLPTMLSDLYKDLNSNKLLAGFIMIAMNIGSRYIELKLTKGQELLIKNIAREVLIFTIAFINTKDILSSILSLSMGVTLIEKHFTIDNRLPGRDNKFSILPNDMMKLARTIRIFEQMFKLKKKGFIKPEIEVRKIYTGRWIKK